MAAVASSAAAARNLMTAGGKQGKGKADKLEVEDDEAVELLTSDEEEEQEASGLEEEEEEDEPARKKTAKKKAGAGAGPSKGGWQEVPQLRGAHACGHGQVNMRVDRALACK